MWFDDRLATVLGQPAADAHARAIQWRQLVELVARGGAELDLALRDQALERIARLMDEVPAEVVTATGRAVASPSLPLELVALFAARGAGAAASVVTAARLDESGWAAVRAVAAPDVQPLLPVAQVQSAPDFSAPPVSLPSEPVFAEPPVDRTAEIREALLEMAAAAVRSAEPASSPPAVRPRPPEGVSRAPVDLPPPEAGLFRWECGPDGEIEWVDGAARGAIIGRNLAEPFARRFKERLPFSDEPLVLAAEGELAGEWRWSGAPAFFAESGRFAGYRGIARRDGIEALVDPAQAASPPVDDDLRELMHELRTPLNAIIGFGEIIEGQYLGPAHRAYRERAQAIVGAARRLAEAVDNLDLCAKMRSGRYEGETTADPAIVRAKLDELQAGARDGGVRLRIEERAQRRRLALPPLLAERLVAQFAGALIETADAGETVTAVLDTLGGQYALAVERPAALHGLGEEQLIGGADVAGLRFAIRLVQGLAIMLGGRLDVAADRLILLLPLVRE